MNKRQFPTIRSSEITPEAVYLNRRQFMKGAAFVAGGALLAACAPQVAPGDSAHRSRYIYRSEKTAGRSLDVV